MFSKTGLHLLLIDPDDDLRYLLKALLELAGCDVEEAKNCAEAIASIERRVPDLIFTELFFEEAAGIAFGSQLRSIPFAKDTVLVALTSHHYPGMAQDAREAGFDNYLLKPVQYQNIMDVLAGAAKARGCRLIELHTAPKAAA